MVKIYILEKNDIPFYVGKSKTPKRRFYKHRIKWGDNIKLSIIDEVEEMEWKLWECYWIDQFKQWGFILENQNKGGGGPEFHRDEIKQKMSKPRKAGTGDKIRKTLIERNHSQYYTKEVKNKISQGNKIPKPFTKKHIQNIGIAKRKQATPVLQYDLKGNFIKEWESKGQAAQWFKEQTGKTSNLVSQIKDCILGRQKTALGYKWKYKQNE